MCDGNCASCAGGGDRPSIEDCRLCAQQARPRCDCAARKLAMCLRQYPRRIVLLRHGESVANVRPDVYATVPDCKIGLTARGRQQARRAAHALADVAAGGRVAFFVSPFLRTRQTLAEIYRECRQQLCCVTVREDPRLREQEWGNYQKAPEIQRSLVERRRVGAFYYRFANGESGADVYDRVSSFLESLFRAFKHSLAADTVCIVTHGLAARMFLTRYFHWPIEVFHDLYNLENCQLVVLERPPDSKAFVLRSELRSGRGLYKLFDPRARPDRGWHYIEYLLQAGLLGTPGAPGAPLAADDDSPACLEERDYDRADSCDDGDGGDGGDSGGGSYGDGHSSGGSDCEEEPCTPRKR